MLLCACTVRSAGKHQVGSFELTDGKLDVIFAIGTWFPSKFVVTQDNTVRPAVLKTFSLTPLKKSFVNLFKFEFMVGYVF